MSKVTDKQCADAVKTLVDWQQGSMAELARVAAVSRVAVFKWAATGRVGEGAAVLLGALPGAPLTAQQIRPDLDPLFTQAFMTKETKAAIKAQTLYLKKRDDAVKKKKAAAAVRELKEIATGRRTRFAKRVKA